MKKGFADIGIKEAYSMTTSQHPSRNGTYPYDSVKLDYLKKQNELGSRCFLRVPRKEQSPVNTLILRL